MSKIATDFRFGYNSALSTGSYTSGSIWAGNLFVNNTGPNYDDNFMGPAPIGVARPLEQTAATAMNYVHAIQYTNNIFWVLLCDGSTAAATRKIYLYEYRLDNQSFNWKGFLTLTFPAGVGTKTIRAMRTINYQYTTGSIAASGTAITGTGTLWSGSRFSIGSRIGIGSIDPSQIAPASWSQVSAITNDTSITVTNNVGTVAGSTPYVLEELRLAVVTTDSVPVSGGLFLVKGINHDTFTTNGTFIGAATTVDNSQSVYFLSDNASNAACVATTAAGLGTNAVQDWATHNCYLLNGGGGATPRIMKYNLRTNLVPVLGRDGGNSLLFQTNQQATTGNVSSTNNGRLGTLNHGPASGQSSFYFTTATRVYRAAESLITSGSVTWQSDLMTEVPPGGTNIAYAASANMTAVEILGTVDRLAIMTLPGGNARNWVTQYNTIASPFDHVFLIDNRQEDQASAAGVGAYPFPSLSTSAMTIWETNGMAFLVRQSTVVAQNQLYSMPIGAHWTYASASGQYATTPEIRTSGATKFYNAYVASDRQLGVSTEIGQTPEPYRISARTSGISDNSGAWTLLNDCGDLSSFGAANSIQYKFEFRVIGDTCIPARIFNVCTTYETDNNLPVEHEWNMNDSNLNDGTIGYKQITSISPSGSNYQIDYFRGDNDSNVLSQDSKSTTNGSFQWYSASVWTPGTGSNSAGTRRRFVPTSGLPSGVDVYARIKYVS